MKYVFAIMVLLLLTGCSSINPDFNETFKDYRHPKLLNDSIVDDIILNITTNISQNTSGYVSNPDRDYLIGAFNIQIFGVTKANNEPVMVAIKDIIEDYDIIGLQEIRDVSGTVPQKVKEMLPDMRVLDSGALGRSTSKENYLVIYDPLLFTVKASEVYPDPNDYFEREPHIVVFKKGGFDFAYVLLHAKPDDANEEIKHLEDVVEYIENKYREDDIIIFGDFNHACSYTSGEGLLENYTWLIDKEVDTTTGLSSCAYDRIVSVKDYGNMIHDCAVDYYENDGIVDMDLIQAVSDHWSTGCLFDI